MGPTNKLSWITRRQSTAISLKPAFPCSTPTYSGADVVRSSHRRSHRSNMRRGRSASAFCENEIDVTTTVVETEGKVFLVGAGPGDPGLLTVRGKHLIDSADAVVYDALANSALLPPGARETGRPELYYVGKRGGAKNPVTQHEINELLVKLAREGKRVVRLTGGDPFVFGRGSEEAQAMNDASVQFEVIPGITAGIAAPAYAGIPVTHRGLSTSVTFVTGHEDPTKPSAQ